MAITAAIIAAVVFIVNQPTAAAGDVTNVTLTAIATGQAPVVGQPAPDFSATTVDGKAVKLSDFRGTPVWLTFGASWCQPCRAENPDIRPPSTRSKKANGLAILSVFISEDAATVSDYADRVGLELRQDRRPEHDDRLAVSDPRHPVALLHRQHRRPARDEDRQSRPGRHGSGHRGHPPVTDGASPGADTEPEIEPEPEIEAVTSGAPRRRAIRRLFARIVRSVRRIPHPSLRTKRGRFVALILVAGFGMAVAVGGVTAMTYTETADFCGRCHTMDPELKAYEMSAHREVPCAECHVEPGVVGWIKAKINGTRQLIGVLTGTFPTPIPAPDHADLPPTSDTCIRCHDSKALVANGGPVKLVIQEKFHEDEPNTKDTIALVLRPAGFGTPSQSRGLHWHIDSEVDYIAPDPRAQTIDYVAIKGEEGEAPEEFISSAQVTDSGNVQPDIDRLKANGTERRMDCIDCHNRAGHGILTPDQAIDDALSNGKIDREPALRQAGSESIG